MKKDISVYARQIRQHDSQDQPSMPSSHAEPGAYARQRDEAQTTTATTVSGQTTNATATPYRLNSADNSGGKLNNVTATLHRLNSANHSGNDSNHASRNLNSSSDNHHSYAVNTTLAAPFELAHRQPAVESLNEHYRKPRYESIRRVFHSKSGLIGAILLTSIILLALIGPLISGYAPNAVDMKIQNLPPRLPVVEQLGFWNGETRGENPYIERGLQQEYHYFGTDTLGRDLWTRVFTGTRISLFVAMVAVCIDIVIGITYGMISGYFGGRVDLVMQRIIEVIAGIPSLVVITLFMIILKPGLITIIIALMITNWIGMSRIVRAQVLRLKQQDYVLAARTLGASDFMILLREILPNMYGTIIIMAMMSIPEAIFIESFLSFIGLGIPEPTASLGTLISTGFKSMMIHPYMVAIPVVVFALLMISFNLLADSLRDALDSKLKI